MEEQKDRSSSSRHMAVYKTFSVGKFLDDCEKMSESLTALACMDFDDEEDTVAAGAGSESETETGPVPVPVPPTPDSE